MADDVSEGDVNESSVVTWHHGLIARWWANFNLDGPEIEFFRPYVESGQPALDVACGSGRLLVPWVKRGLEVDGVDASADMIDACRAAASGVGRAPNLFVQATHLLDLPRKYGTIIMCGSLGLGVTREQDLEGLRRVRAHLLPKGQLALDCEVGEFDFDAWKAKGGARSANDEPPTSEQRQLGADGFLYALRHRITALDVEAKSARRELQAWQWLGDELVAHETHALVVNIYSPAEIVALLEQAGFVNVRVVGGYHGKPPKGDEAFLVYLATASPEYESSRRPGHDVTRGGVFVT